MSRGIMGCRSVEIYLKAQLQLLELGGCAARRQNGIGLWNSPSRTCAVRTCVGEARARPGRRARRRRGSLPATACVSSPSEKYNQKSC